MNIEDNFFSVNEEKIIFDEIENKGIELTKNIKNKLNKHYIKNIEENINNFLLEIKDIYNEYKKKLVKNLEQVLNDNNLKFN